MKEIILLLALLIIVVIVGFLLIWFTIENMAIRFERELDKLKKYFKE